MTKVRILANTRLNRVFYGRDSLIDVSAEEAARLASIGIGEMLYINDLDEADRIEQPVEPEQQQDQEQPKASKPKAKKAVKK